MYMIVQYNRPDGKGQRRKCVVRRAVSGPISEEMLGEGEFV
jgi:hypothetical protein